MATINRTIMAQAFVKGLNQCIKSGRNPGKIGRHILTADARGIGQKNNNRRSQQISAK